MKHFIVGIVFEEIDYKYLKEEYYDREDNTESLYDYFADGDYVNYVLFDVTDPQNPVTVMTGDNTHTPIETMIGSFLTGCDYAGLKYSLTENVLFVVEKDPAHIKYENCRKVN